MATAPTTPDVQVGQFLFGSSAYSVLKFLDEGTFGKVAKCKNLATKELVAVKIMKDGSNVTEDTEREVSILETISVLGPDRINVVKFIEQFVDTEKNYLVFEMLEMNLYDMIGAQGCEPLSLQEIRPIAKQLLVALDALKSLGIVHTDIKPDNIMVVNQQDHPHRIKLIDFGVAIHKSDAKIGEERQPIGYRSPEIALGLPFNEAIDAWGVGCILAFLYLAENLFQVDCEYQMMRGMVAVLGLPSQHLLRNGIYTNFFFCEEEASKYSAHPRWRLLTPEEYSVSFNYQEERRSRIGVPRSLDDLQHIYPKKDAAEYPDSKAFVDLLKRLLHLEGDKRIPPDEALQCPFITMSHLAKRTYTESYLTKAKTIMDLVEDSANQVVTPEDLKPDQELVPYSTKDEDNDSANSSVEEASDTVTSEDAPVSSDAGAVSADKDSDSAWSSSMSLSPLTFDEDEAALTPDVDEDEAALSSDEEFQHPSGKDATDKNSVLFQNDLILESADEFEEGSAGRSANRPFTTRTYDVQFDDDDNDLSSLSSEELLSLSSYGAPEKDENRTPCRDSRDTVTCSTDESTDTSPAPSGRRKKILKRIRKFFRRVAETFCCCCRVED